MSLLFIRLEASASPIMLLICNLLCYIWYAFSAIVQLVVWSHKLVFRQHFTIDLLIYFPKLIVKKEGSRMSDNSHTNSYFLWHAARFLLSVAIIGLPILGAVYAVSALT